MVNVNVLDLRVKDVMTEVPETLPAKLTVGEAYAVLTGERLSGAPVVDEAGNATGVFSVTDILDDLAPVLDPNAAVDAQLLEAIKARPVGEAGWGPPISCGREASLVEACALMVKERVHRVIVLEGTRPVGVLSAIDVVRAVACLGAEGAGAEQGEACP